MADHDDSASTAAAEPLYRWWLGALPTLLGVPTPAAGWPGAVDGDGAKPFPVGPVEQVLAMTQRWLGSVHDGWLRGLIAEAPGDGGAAAASSSTAGRPSLARLGGQLGELPLAAAIEALAPLALNVERAYGGLADAFGLAPVRALVEVVRDLTLAGAEQRRAQLEYAELIADALRQGVQALSARLAEMAARGESVDSVLGLVRLWARTTDQAMHEAMQQPRALQASAALLRASSRARQQRQRAVAIASEALNVPTRAEVDAAYREIQELKRELRRLRKAGAATATDEPAAVSVSAPGPRRSARAAGAKPAAARPVAKSAPARRARRKEAVAA